MGIRPNILIAIVWLSTSIINAQDYAKFKPQLRENIRVPDKWELILETVTEDESIVQTTMDSFRLNEYSRLLKYNRSLCLCEDKWRIQLNKYDLLESALYLPIALNNGIQIDCDKATPIFSKLSEFNGEPSKFIELLKSIWGKNEGFEEFLYEYRISMRLIENFELPSDCKRLKKTHTVLEGQTLYRLSVIYGVSVESIQEANGLGNSTQINSGSILVIP